MVIILICSIKLSIKFVFFEINIIIYIYLINNFTHLILLIKLKNIKNSNLNKEEKYIRFIFLKCLVLIYKTLILYSIEDVLLNHTLYYLIQILFYLCILIFFVLKLIYHI